MDTSVIPDGMYCYKRVSGWIYPEDGGFPYFKTEKCPYWRLIEGLPEQSNGYCDYLQSGDLETEEAGGFGLLWDQVKECGINITWDDDEEIEDE